MKENQQSVTLGHNPAGAFDKSSEQDATGVPPVSPACHSARCVPR